jgi:hypothetical protein
MVIAQRKITQLPFKPLVTSVIVACLAIAIPTPVPKGLNLLSDQRRFYKNCTTLAGSNVMRWVKTQGRCIAKASSFLTIVG